ncbi:putative leucine-rich repeat protein (LRRP) [Trypanosoma grayi]|uniref:putative leucine-rich repeat protein (LRRP) n=1 Tax=Trypanosoma grayi TaxID=71804 RepID=UPI0004F49BFF|nr:putative leucine-rich repeat protein (LRRP) [Trypanosoma grayi]KEG10909.1 putative leucine-rich repeat protein (LRRP) [Trypanosoma grayi]
MDLCLSRRGLQSFDASKLLLETSEKSRQGKNPPPRECYIAVRALDLSHNSITSFTGRHALWCLTVLDLSNNSLSTLDASNLPGGLIRLKLAHNTLQGLQGLATAVPKLQEMDVSVNRITSSAIGDLPKGLTTVLCQSNLIDSVLPFLQLQCLSSLDLSSNQIADLGDLRRLGEIRSLRHLEVRGNPALTEPEALPSLLEAVPKLIRLDRVPLSQAAENQMFKVHRSRSAKGSQSGSQAMVRSGSLSNRSATRRPNGKNESDMETRLLETRVKELTRLVGAAEKSEQQLRYQKKILQDQVLACAGVIDSQAMELERLMGKINELRDEETSLKEPAAELEQTFEQTHASLVAHRLNQSSGRA